MLEILNLWTPTLDPGARKAVMVWLHGGSFIGGSSAAPWYDGANLSRGGDVVVVTVNHRLGAMGCLYLEKYGGAPFATSGCTGLLDIVAALEWVRDNIVAFGGNPDCVTVFGESGGGWKVSTLLAMRGARGLFHRAIIQSGAALRVHAQSDALRVTELMLQELGLREPTMQSLQSVAVDQIIAAQQRLVVRVRGGELPGINYEFRPVVDGVVLERHPFDVDAPSVSAGVPLLIGTNLTEANWGLWRDRELDRLDLEGMKRRLSTQLPVNVDRLVEFYRSQYPSATIRDLFVRITSFPIDSILLAERKAKQGSAAVYMYRFDWPTPVLGGQLGSPHFIEVPFVFNNLELSRGFTGDSAEARRLAAQVSSAWANFARTGIPSASGLPTWSPYDTQARSTMLLNTVSQLVNDPDAAARRAWVAAT